jgi:hypothetical protein
MANQNIKVERAPFEYNGKSYFDYFICGVVRGTEVKIKVGPPDLKDKGGYTVLDIVFGNESEADFITEPFEFKNSEGKTVAGERFLVRTVDKETGETYECAIKPVKNSDKTLLAMLMR